MANTNEPRMMWPSTWERVRHGTTYVPSGSSPTRTSSPVLPVGSGSLSPRETTAPVRSSTSIRLYAGSIASENSAKTTAGGSATD